MFGNNELHLSPGMLCVIVQEWVDRNIATKPTVVHVKQASMNNGVFVVSMNDKPRPESVLPPVALTDEPKANVRFEPLPKVERTTSG